MMKIKLFVLLLLFSFCSFNTDNTTSINAIKSELLKLQKSSNMDRGLLSVYLYDIKTDSVLIDFNGNTGLVPASTLKTVTTAAALSLLGESFKYETILEYDGKIDSVNKVLKGNVYIKGFGDPTLGSKYFLKSASDSANKFMTEWIAKLKSLKIYKIEGSIIADASSFEDEVTPATWIWGDMGNYYGVGASGLNYRDNLYTVFFNSSAAGVPAKIAKISPPIKGLSLVNNVKGGGSGDNCYIYGAPYTYQRTALGTVPVNKINFDVDGSMPDATNYLAYEFDSIARLSGIVIEGNPTTIRELQLNGMNKNNSRITITKLFSPPLSDIVYYTNKKSINLYAECLLKTIAYKQYGVGTLSGGTNYLKEFWSSKGMDTKGLYLNDGSGLSRWNSISAKQLTQLMKIMTKEKTFNVFFNSLPVQSEGVYAKSGYITRVRSYAGYVKKSNGDLLAFALIANNYDCNATEIRVKLQSIMEKMTAIK